MGMSDPEKISWYAKPLPEVFRILDTREDGLSQEEAALLMERFGPNRLPENPPESVFILFLRQFLSPLIAILLLASVIVFFRGDHVDGFIILFILVFNAVVGTIQEGRAKNTLQALKRFTTGTATVLRGGREMILSDEDIVPGDVIFLHEGEKVPADARIIAARNLRVEQSSLTGESAPTHKNAETLAEAGISVSDMSDMVFRGTHVASGSGEAVVVATGERTEIGLISGRIAEIDTEIPLQREVKSLARGVALIVPIFCALIFVLGVSMGKPVGEMFATVVSLSVAVVPEGLPIVLTIVLATGMWRMSRHQVLVKRLQAVEALGGITVLAVDKTGTITGNKIIIEKVCLPGTVFDIDGSGYVPEGGIRQDGRTIDPANHSELLLLGKIAALSSGANLVYDESSSEWRISGDPTEGAMLVFARKVGFSRERIATELPRIAEIPFDYRTKIHVSLHGSDGDRFMSMTGAPEAVLARSRYFRRDGETLPLTDEARKRFEHEYVALSRTGSRVVAAAFREGNHETILIEDAEDMVFAGFFSMKDALRVGVREAVSSVRGAGVHLVMITGDNRETAISIAREAGIFRSGDDVLSGEDVERMDEDDIVSRLGRVSVFARVTPEHKLRIVEAYRKRGDVIAMTGDGVNDAPSLVAADVGVAMGRIGTDVAKEASDMILLDDRFEHILKAMEEGRSIYRAIRKVVLFLFSTNVAELVTITLAILLGYPLPLLAVQILWLNLVADGFLDVSLAMEPKERGLLEGEGRGRMFRRALIDRHSVIRMAVMALPMALGTLWLFSQALPGGIEKAWTVSLTALAVFHWFNVWNCRSEDVSIFRMPLFSNRYLLGALALIVTLQLFAVYHPFMQEILRTAPLALRDWGMIAVVASSIVVVEELRKLTYRSFKIRI